MNIKITKEEHLLLMDRREEFIVIGSHLYGTNNESSDRDILCFYTDNEVDYSGLPNHHQFQYDGEDTDYIWTTKQQFMRNLQSGDSTINADVVMFTDYLTDDPILKLKIVHTYKIIRAFLGFANRDIKQINKNPKKGHHAVRSVYCAEMLLGEKLPNLQVIRELHKQQPNIKSLQTQCNDLRKQLNSLYEVNKIETYYVPDVNGTLKQKLYNANNIKEFRYD